MSQPGASDPKPGPKRRPYRPPVVTEILLDTKEAMLTPCTTQVVASPPCPPPNFSVLPLK
jgi:hypothetical protein